MGFFSFKLLQGCYVPWTPCSYTAVFHQRESCPLPVIHPSLWCLMWCKLNTFSNKALIFWEEPKGLNCTKTVSIESLIFLHGFEIYHTFSNIWFLIIYAETYFKLLVCTLVEISKPFKVMLNSTGVFSRICYGLKEIWKGQIIHFFLLCCQL